VEEKEHFSKVNFDDMWKQILQFKYPNLKSLLNAVRALPNSNADPERTFSFLSDLKTKKRNSLSTTSVNAICVFKSALKTRKETVLNMEINAKHLSLMTMLSVLRKRKTVLHYMLLMLMTFVVRRLMMNVRMFKVK